MSLIRLTETYASPDFWCPHCNKPIDVDWDTEYGDPLHGESIEKCPCCDMEFNLNVEVEVRYSPSAIPGKTPGAGL